MKRLSKIFEEMNAGAIAGSGDERLAPDQREPGLTPKRRRKYKRKNEQDTALLRRRVAALVEENTGMFAGKVTHKVPRHVYTKIVHEKAKGKHWRKYLGDDEVTSRIRDYAIRNPKKPVVIEDESTGYMCFARYGR